MFFDMGVTGFDGDVEAKAAGGVRRLLLNQAAKHDKCQRTRLRCSLSKL